MATARAALGVAGHGGVAVVVLTLAFTSHPSAPAMGKTEGPVLDFAVKHGPLTISVAESGTIKSREPIIVKSEVEGRATIISLVEEGVHVKAGDLLIELDASKLNDQKVDQQIIVQNAEAALIRARENLQIVTSQGESDVTQADLNLQFANLDQHKYLEGDFPLADHQARTDMIIAEETLKRAQDREDWSRKLAADGYVTGMELTADELAAKQAQLTLDMAKEKLHVLKDFTYKRTVEDLKTKVEQAVRALDREQRKAGANVIGAQADLRARDSEWQRQTKKLDKLVTQIAKCKIVSPVDGVVVYSTTMSRGRWGNQEPLKTGQEVVERQELIQLPTSASMLAEVQIHEASLKKIEIGQAVIVTTDALPGLVLHGKVAKIAPMADNQAWWDPALKVYTTQIHLDENPPELRPGMTCRAEIIVAEYADALYVPVQCVVRIHDQPTVYVTTEDGAEAKSVEIGLDNNRMVHIISGVEAGEHVLLAPPLQPTTAPGSEEGTEEEEPNHAATQPATTQPAATQPAATQPATAPTTQPDDRRPHRTWHPTPATTTEP